MHTARHETDDLANFFARSERYIWLDLPSYLGAPP
jgi:hypothetical protein